MDTITEQAFEAARRDFESGRLGPAEERLECVLDELERIQGFPGDENRTPLENFLHLGFIATLFPRARVIHCRRDPLDVCLSCHFQNLQGLNFTWSLEGLGFYYRQCERLMAHWREVLP